MPEVVLLLISPLPTESLNLTSHSSVQTSPSPPLPTPILTHKLLDKQHASSPRKHPRHPQRLLPRRRRSALTRDRSRRDRSRRVRPHTPTPRTLRTPHRTRRIPHPTTSLHTTARTQLRRHRRTKRIRDGNRRRQTRRSSSIRRIRPHDIGETLRSAAEQRLGAHIHAERLRLRPRRLARLRAGEAKEAEERRVAERGEAHLGEQSGVGEAGWGAAGGVGFLPPSLGGGGCSGVLGSFAESGPEDGVCGAGL